MLAVLAILAISGLYVGVTNDAVNFLNAAIGSKVAKMRTILAVASVGIIIGVLTSSGMMEVARSGMFNPGLFTFHEIMILYVSVMFANVILLDIYAFHRYTGNSTYLSHSQDLQFQMQAMG